MKQIQLNSGVFLLVEMPGDAIRFRVENGLLIWTTSLYEKTKQAEDDKWEVLPLLEITEEWEIIGKGNEIEEEVWRDVVDWFQETGYLNLYLDYLQTETKKGFVLANSSGHSWIKSHGMKPETTLILKLK